MRTGSFVRSAIGDRDLDDFVQAVWILAETWFAFLELDNPDPASDDGARLLTVVLAPYLVERG